MHHVAFIVYPGFELLDVSGPASVFNGANRSLRQRGKPALYKVGLMSAEGRVIASSCGVAVETRPIAEIRPGEARTVLVAGAEREPLLQAVGDPALRAALPQLAARSRTFRLGLHRGLCPRRPRSSRRPPHRDALGCQQAALGGLSQVTVDPDALYVVDGRLWTSAGVTTGIDMALAMVDA